jgi:hypothetical protein
MAETFDFQKVVRQAAAYGAAVKQLPLQLAIPDEMDPEEGMAFTAVANSIFVHLNSLTKAGVDPAAAAIGASVGLGSFIKEHCPEQVLERFAKTVSESVEHFSLKTQKESK